jgi:hypothetical protein
MLSWGGLRTWGAGVVIVRVRCDRTKGGRERTGRSMSFNSARERRFVALLFA